ncbi:serine dehydratase [Acidovorax sp. Leaf76]|uniref:L-serine ammonia-lyase n=1 Tax=unclassified Acidovorax TaxID=2684926 RepID=UPI0006F2BD39|nr:MULTISPECIES: L-serine ammonia-lyase [unclassified Acidovorax]KQO15277.1 serine dehydratase [Acidovorax sp. Leaf76]KQO32093.1 serine dehydratase [Acidovorax sp. Leaf84]KQS29590.1 serine dehydratase [Acidovorax sp. Leaf191]
MSVSVFDLFKIGIGPSSSHTVGPMIAARQFACHLQAGAGLAAVQGIAVELFGSLSATGVGHGTDKAVLLGLAGFEPDTIDPDQIDPTIAAIRASQTLNLLGERTVPFIEKEHLLFRRKSLPLHPNGMCFHAFDAQGTEIAQREYYSVGGGFVIDAAGERVLNQAGSAQPGSAGHAQGLPHPFRTGAEMLAQCQATGLTPAQLMAVNEAHWRSAAEVRRQLLAIWRTMAGAVQRGCASTGHLPGPMRVRRRAAELHRNLKAHPEAALRDPLSMLDWVNLYAMAVNEENAAGGRVVTAPTNGAAGVIPAVLHYYVNFLQGAREGSAANEDGIATFLLTAGAIGIIYKENASLSGAEVGCQGEVGVACSMAAGALAAVMGGTPEQIENAAEIGMEHNLGMTCDPVGGLVQIPCIERNAMGAIKAINAARMALRGDGQHVVSLDKVIKTMMQTGADMKVKYKETSRGGLAVNVVEC